MLKKYVGAFALLLGVGVSGQAQAQITATATVGPQPTDMTLVQDEEFFVNILLSNTSIDGATAIPARFLAGSTITVTLACQDSVCTMPIGGTLQFVAGALPNGCQTDPGAAFTSCAPSGNNTVILTLGQNIDLDPSQTNLNVGSFKVKAIQPVVNPLSGMFRMRAASSMGGFEACSPDLNPGSICSGGDAAGSSILFFPGTCDMKVDKQVSCDGGITWVDQGLQSANGDGNGTCSAPDAAPIQVRYQVQNSGALAASQCTLTESNADFGVPGFMNQTVAANTTTSFIPGTSTPQCSAAAGNEPDTATVTCNLCGGAAAQGLTASDGATFSCNAPALMVTKECSVDPGNQASFTVTAKNTGQTSLQSCAATDTLHDGGKCPPAGNTLAVSLTPAGTFDLATNGSMQQLSGGPITLTTDSCNSASVTCTVPGGGGSITATGTADCPFTTPPPPPEACLTRTPGFWGTHPAITETFLNITLCGTELDNVDAGNGASTTEAICSVGKDNKIQGPQLTQLIRQCTAATLNTTASVAMQGGCSPAIDQLISDCCGDQSICTGDSVPGRGIDSCLSLLDAFNSTELLDFPFPTGPADSEPCRGSKGNGVVVVPTP